MWSAVSLHTAFLWYEHHPFGTFDCTILASYLLFAEWPRERLLVLYYEGRLQRWLERLDWGNAFEWRRLELEGARDRLQVLSGSKVWTGFAACRVLVLYNPVPYYFLFLVLPAAGLARTSLGNWLITALLVLFAPFFTSRGPIER